MPDHRFISIVKLTFIAAKRGNISSESDKLFVIPAFPRQLANDFCAGGKVEIGFLVFGFIIYNDSAFADDAFRQIFRNFRRF